MPMQTSYNSGEYSPLMGGGVDYEKRAWAVDRMENLIALKQGPCTTRGPTIFVDEVKDSAARSHLWEFEGTNTSYVLEIGDQYIRFYKDYAQVLDSGSPVELATPYVQADLFDSNNRFRLQFAQSGDTLFIVHPDYEPAAVVRTDDVTWALNILNFDDGPYLDENGTSTTLTLSGTSGSVTVTASSTTGINDGTGFQTTDVGRLIRWKDPANNWTWLKITARTSTTVVTASFQGAAASAGTATVHWRLGTYSGTTGYPSVIAFFQDRLALLAPPSYPDRYDLSTIRGYSKSLLAFRPTNAAGTVADDNAISGNIPSGQVSNIQWAAADTKGFLIGTSKEEFLLRPSVFGEALTPANAKADILSSTGGAPIPPLRSNSGATFVQQFGRRVFDIEYTYEQDTLMPHDTTLAAEHITRGKIIAGKNQKEPVNIKWFVLNTGGLIGITHYPDEKVYGWHRHTIGGVSDAEGAPAIVESVAVIQSPGGDRDDLWMIVKRYINGGTKRYVEYAQRYYEDDIDSRDWAFCDSRLIYDGAETDTVTGLDHLEGQTVRVMLDGKSHPNLVVNGGEITLANGRVGSKIHVGLPITWTLRLLEPELKLPNKDTTQGKMKRISDLVVRVLNTLGFSYGVPGSTAVEHDFDQAQSYNETPALFSGDIGPLAWPGGPTRKLEMEFTGSRVFPATIVAHTFDFRAQG